MPTPPPMARHGGKVPDYADQIRDNPEPAPALAEGPANTWHAVVRSDPEFADQLRNIPEPAQDPFEACRTLALRKGG
jgi:hypothetical protein